MDRDTATIPRDIVVSLITNAAEWPDKEALVLARRDGGTLTYRELVARTAATAAALASVSDPDRPPEHTVYEPRIHTKNASINVLIEKNIIGTQGFMPIDAGPDHVLVDNFLAQRKRPAGSDYYGNLFVNGLADAAGVPDDYRGVPGGLVEQKGVGVRF